jgi:hypothetical protein
MRDNKLKQEQVIAVLQLLPALDKNIWSKRHFPSRFG